MLQHEVMVVDEWHNNGPQDLVTVSLCIQNAINKMLIECLILWNAFGDGLWLAKYNICDS